MAVKLRKKRCVSPVLDGDIVLLFLRSASGYVYSEPLRYYVIIHIMYTCTYNSSSNHKKLSLTILSGQRTSFINDCKYNNISSACMVQ